MLIWAAVIVVVLSFLAALLAGVITRGSTNAEPVAVETISATLTPEGILPDQIYPAGSDLRAGRGTPPAGTGADGDVYVDTDTATVWMRRYSNWQQAGNIRDSAAENLTGETGATGAAGATGAPGEPGTKVILGVGAPDPLERATDGEVYIDTVASDYFSCVDNVSTLFGPGGAVPLSN